MMMNTAYSIDSNHPFYPMLFARSNYVDGVISKTIEDKTYEYNKLPYFPEVNDLEKTVKGEKTSSHGICKILAWLLSLPKTSTCIIQLYGSRNIKLYTAYWIIFSIHLLNQKENRKKGLLKESIKSILAFAIGYTGMWITKWILVDMIYGRELIKNAIGQAIYRIDSLNI